eukprot:1019963-Pleurochrysis_carterae.AAC.2
MQPPHASAQVSSYVSTAMQRLVQRDAGAFGPPLSMHSAVGAARRCVPGGRAGASVVWWQVRRMGLAQIDAAGAQSK